MSPPEKKRKLSSLSDDNEDGPRKAARSLFADSMSCKLNSTTEAPTEVGVCMPAKFDRPSELHHTKGSPGDLSTSLELNHDELLFASARGSNKLGMEDSSLKYEQLSTPDHDHSRITTSGLAMGNSSATSAKSTELASRVSSLSESEDGLRLSYESDETMIDRDSSPTVSESDPPYLQVKETEGLPAESGSITVDVGVWRALIEIAGCWGQAIVTFEGKCRDIIADTNITLVKTLDKVFKERIQRYKSRILSLKSQLAHRNNTIAYLHTQLGTYDEKDDAWFIRGFTSLHSGIRHWILQHFKGVTEIANRIYRRGSWYLFQDDENSTWYRKLEPRKEVSCLLHSYIMCILQARIYDLQHCGISDEYQVELFSIGSQIEDESERIKWRSKTLRLMLPDDRKLEDIEVVKERVLRFVQDVDNMIGSYASQSSDTVCRQYGVRKIAIEAALIAHENRMRSTAEFNIVWPRPGQHFGPEHMDIFGSTGAVAHIDKTVAVIEGTLFPEIEKTSTEQDGFRYKTTLRKAYVCLADPCNSGLGEQDESFRHIS